MLARAARQLGRKRTRSHGRGSLHRDTRRVGRRHMALEPFSAGPGSHAHGFGATCPLAHRTHHPLGQEYTCPGHRRGQTTAHGGQWPNALKYGVIQGGRLPQDIGECCTDRPRQDRRMGSHEAQVLASVPHAAKLLANVWPRHREGAHATLVRVSGAILVRRHTPMDAKTAARSNIDAVANDTTSVVCVAMMRRGYQCVLQAHHDLVRMCRSRSPGSQLGLCTGHLLVALGRTRCSRGGQRLQPSVVAHLLVARRHVPRDTSRPSLAHFGSDKKPTREQYHGCTSRTMGRPCTESVQYAYSSFHALAAGCTRQAGVAAARGIVRTDASTPSSGERGAARAMDDRRDAAT